MCGKNKERAENNQSETAGKEHAASLKRATCINKGWTLTPTLSQGEQRCRVRIKRKTKILLLGIERKTKISQRVTF